MFQKSCFHFHTRFPSKKILNFGFGFVTGHGTVDSLAIPIGTAGLVLETEKNVRTAGIQHDTPASSFHLEPAGFPERFASKFRSALFRIFTQRIGMVLHLTFHNMDLKYCEIVILSKHRDKLHMFPNNCFRIGMCRLQVEY